MTLFMPARFVRSLVNRKERWGLSGRGWLVLSVVLILSFAGWTLNIQPFLVETQRVPSDVLVVEGWIHEFAIRQAVKEFQAGHYRIIYATGGPIEGSGGYVNDFNTSASVGADLLVKDGIPPESVQMVPSHVSGRDRTYSSAVALREWFHEHHVAVSGFNLLTEDAHARRSRLLYQEAFGRDVAVGVIAAPDPDYDAKRWWYYSEGVREILGESIAYLYAKFFFWPGKN